MAARINKVSSETEKRLKRGSALINRLEKHQLGEITLTKDQIRSIEIILKYTLPTYRNVEADVTGKLDLQVSKIEEVIIDK